jgi:glycosyltransferase involved in cell wall biosynthesis
LESVFQGTSDKVELIVVNDDRDKERSRVIHDWFDDDARIRLVDNTNVAGPAGARNFGAKLAEGDFLLFLDDDDQILTGYVDLLLDYLSKTPDADWGFSKVFFAKNEYQLSKSPRRAKGTFKKYIGKPRKIHLAGLGYGFWIRRSLLIELGFIDESLITNEDTELCLRLLAMNKLPHVFSHFGVTIDSAIPTVSKEQASITRSSTRRSRWKSFSYIIDKHWSFLETNSELRNHLLKRYLKFLAKDQQSLKVFGVTNKILNPLFKIYFYLNRLAY